MHAIRAFLVSNIGNAFLLLFAGLALWRLWTERATFPVILFVFYMLTAGVMALVAIVKWFINRDKPASSVHRRTPRRIWLQVEVMSTLFCASAAAIFYFHLGRHVVGTVYAVAFAVLLSITLWTNVIHRRHTAPALTPA